MYIDDDPFTNLRWLKEFSQEHQVDVLAYCLMSNYIPLIVVPGSEEGLNQMLKSLHLRYGQHTNREKGCKGHLWQERYFSSALDEVYLLTAIRCVERNHVRAKMVRTAVRYLGSNAAARCGLQENIVLTKKLKWEKQLSQITNLNVWLAEGTMRTRH